jgi:hypothetical protein
MLARAEVIVKWIQCAGPVHVASGSAEHGLQKTLGRPTSNFQRLHNWRRSGDHVEGGVRTESIQAQTGVKMSTSRLDLTPLCTTSIGSTHHTTKLLVGATRTLSSHASPALKWARQSEKTRSEEQVGGGSKSLARTPW